MVGTGCGAGMWRVCVGYVDLGALLRLFLTHSPTNARRPPPLPPCASPLPPPPSLLAAGRIRRTAGGGRSAPTRTSTRSTTATRTSTRRLSAPLARTLPRSRPTSSAARRCPREVRGGRRCVSSPLFTVDKVSGRRWAGWAGGALRSHGTTACCVEGAGGCPSHASLHRTASPPVAEPLRRSTQSRGGITRILIYYQSAHSKTTHYYCGGNS